MIQAVEQAAGGERLETRRIPDIAGKVPMIPDSPNRSATRRWNSPTAVDATAPALTPGNEARQAGSAILSEFVMRRRVLADNDGAAVLAERTVRETRRPQSPILHGILDTTAP